MNVSIIIVNYNTKSLTLNCLKSIFEQTRDISFEVIISDNGSTDGSIEAIKTNFPQVILLENKKNLGFGAANNKGLEIAKGKYIFYLNSDTILLNNAVKLFFDYFELNGDKDNLGVIGCNLYDFSMKYGNSYGFFKSRFHTLKVSFIDFLRITKASIFGDKKVKENNTSKDKSLMNFTGYVDFVIGADMFLRNNQYAKFDEDFFMYVEEINLQLQMKKYGYNAYIINEPKIIHLEGASSSNSKPKSVLEFYSSFSKLNHMVSSIIYIKKTGFYPVTLFLTRVFTSLCMLNPKIYKYSKQYLKKIWK